MSFRPTTLHIIFIIQKNLTVSFNRISNRKEFNSGSPIRISKQNYATAPKFESANLKISRVPKFAFKENIGNPSHL